MADRRSRESTWKHGWPSVIVVVLVMVAAGFAVGVIAGITWEEPALVVGHLSGQTEEIDWGVGKEDSEPAGLVAKDATLKPPSVAAAPPLGQREKPDAGVSDPATSGAGAGVASARKSAPAVPQRATSGAGAGAAPTRKSAPAVAQPTSGFAVQVGAFSEKSAAQALADSLIAHGYPVYLSPTEGAPANWRVRVGPMSTRPEAEKTARRLEAAEKLPTWVLGEGS
jgi:cell division septation protein DedD